MTIQFWRLSEAGESNLGLACTADGLLLGRTPIVARVGERFVVREQREIERLFSRAYHDASAVERIISGLGTVAAALNADDWCLACIAAVHLRISDLPDLSARDRIEAEDALIKYARGESPTPVGTRQSTCAPARRPTPAGSRRLTAGATNHRRYVPRQTRIRTSKMTPRSRGKANRASCGKRHGGLRES